MKNNIIALPVGRIRRDTRVLHRKEDKDQDLFVDMVESNLGHIARREAKRKAYYETRQQEQEDAQWLTSLLAQTTAFSLIIGTLAVALALVL